jgi:hypothetical protein
MVERIIHGVGVDVALLRAVGSEDVFWRFGGVPLELGLGVGSMSSRFEGAM